MIKITPFLRLGKSFWKRWDTTHSGLTKKRQGSVNLNRALNCTREMAIQHLDDLAEELKRLGIFTEAVQKEPGVWTGNIDTSRYFHTYCWTTDVKSFFVSV